MRTGQWMPNPVGALGRTHGDAGLTLPELLMVMAIASIIGGMVLSSFLTISNITVRMAERAEDEIEAKMTTDELTTVLRGATRDPSNPDAGVFQIARPHEIKLLTRAGQGFSGSPRWVHYRVRNRSIYRVDEQGHESLMMTGLQPILPFRFYRYDPAYGQSKFGNCFVSLDNTDLNDQSMRRQIVGLQVQIQRRGPDNVREHKVSMSGEFVRIPEHTLEGILPSGEQLHDWRNTCWETQTLRVKQRERRANGASS